MNEVAHERQYPSKPGRLVVACLLRFYVSHLPEGAATRREGDPEATCGRHFRPELVLPWCGVSKTVTVSLVA